VDDEVESMDGSLDGSVNESMDGSIDESLEESIIDPSVDESTGINSVGSINSGIFHAEHMRISGKADITWNKYEQNWKRFHKWLLAKGHMELLVDGKDLNVRSQLFGSIRLPIPQIIFDSYLTSLVHKPNGDLKHISVPKVFWATLKYAHEQSRPMIEVPYAMQVSWKNYSKGYKRVKVKQVVDRGLSVYEGKDSLSREGFINLQKKTLTGLLNKHQMLWIPQMNVASRNLVARISSVGQLTTTTIRWKGDALCLTIPRHKSDQSGDRIVERHVHANPKDPFCCFIFWLGIKILCDPTAGTSHFLFGDDDIIVDGRRRVSKKDEAFGDWMKRALCGTRKDPIPLDLQIRLWGCPGKDLGAHSNRKGSYELLCGIIDGPPVAAAMIRAGHKIGGVEEKYILQPRGGDEYCSRVCAGFDVHSDDFATLPAHFTQDLLRSINWSDFVWNHNSYPHGFQSAIAWLVVSVVHQWKTG
jgi:hypothetical protein